MPSKKILDILGNKAASLLAHECKTVDKSTLTLPSPQFIENTWIDSNRNNRVLGNLQLLAGHGRLANTGYMSDTAGGPGV